MTNKIKFSELVKGDKIIHSHMGTNPAVSGVIKDSPKQGRGVKSTILVDVKTQRKGLDWFQKYFTDQYYVLLD